MSCGSEGKYSKASSREEFFSYFAKLSDALKLICEAEDSLKSDIRFSIMFDKMIDYSTVNKMYLTDEELNMLQKFFHQTVGHSEDMEQKHRELFGEPWMEKSVTSTDNTKIDSSSKNPQDIC